MRFLYELNVELVLVRHKIIMATNSVSNQMKRMCDNPHCTMVNMQQRKLVLTLAHSIKYFCILRYRVNYKSHKSVFFFYNTHFLAASPLVGWGW